LTSLLFLEPYETCLNIVLISLINAYDYFSCNVGQHTHTPTQTHTHTKSHTHTYIYIYKRRYRIRSIKQKTHNDKQAKTSMTLLEHCRSFLSTQHTQMPCIGQGHAHHKQAMVFGVAVTNRVHHKGPRKNTPNCVCVPAFTNAIGSICGATANTDATAIICGLAAVTVHVCRQRVHGSQRLCRALLHFGKLLRLHLSMHTYIHTYIHVHIHTQAEIEIETETYIYMHSHFFMH
jgi:hypothetical protein